MKRRTLTLTCFAIAILIAFATSAQTTHTISGNIKSTSNERLAAVSIVVKGTGIGTFTDDKGSFKLTGSFSFPLTLVISSVGFATQEIAVADATQPVSVSLVPVAMLAQEVVVSASRLPERILEAPVTVERVNAATIRNSPATSYYDIVGTLKGVDVVTSSLNYRTPSTRGFNTSGNLRLNQLVDGMDNQAPGLNFAVGAMVGPTELDVESMELLGGASSALYGPGGMNGTLLINSKNPFKYQGLSVQAKEGVMHIADDARSASAYNDFTLRYAKAFSQKFAFKIGGQYIYGKDWVAQDYRNFDMGSNPATGDVKDGNRQSDANYNGINVYGDETTIDIKPLVPSVLGVIFLPGPPAIIHSSDIIAPYQQGSSFFVSRTGYREKDIIDPTTKNLRLNAALHYKFTPSIEGSLSGNFGYGSTVYTGSDRYSLKNFTMGQYKAEVRHKNWFVRAYTTREDAGKSFNATVTTRLYNEAAQPSPTWYNTYISTLVGGSTALYRSTYLQAYGQASQAGMSDSAARVVAASAASAAIAQNHLNLLAATRDSADKGMPAVGSAEFKRIFDSVASRAIKDGGGRFIDKSSLNMVEAQYNLSDVVKVAELIVGGNFKQYVLNSEGTLFADTTGRIKINEVGACALVAKKLFKDVLKLTASGRYDKNSNFKGRFTPRVSAVVTVAKDQNIRLSFQTAYRFPSTQNQWINLSVGGGTRLIGGLKQLRDYYNFTNNPVYSAESFVDFANAASTAASTSDTIAALSKLRLKTFGEYKPESVTSYEAGYKGLIGGKLLIDLYGYYTEYQNFIGRTNVVQSKTGNKIDLLNDNYRDVFSVSVNSTEKVNTQGYGISLEYLLPNNFSVNGNFYSDEIKNVPADFVAYYNTPKYRTNIGLNNSGLLLKKKLGFSVQYHWQDAFRYQNDFVSGTVQAYGALDAQVSYKFPAIRSLIKLGGTNITNHYYQSGFGMPSVGALFYASFGYNVF